MFDESFPEVRNRVVELLVVSAERLDVSPIVKYSALCLFADRLCFRLSDSRRERGRCMDTWLLRPLTESGLQLFGLISLWISSKIHDSQPLSVMSLKCFGDKVIKDQHFTTRDYIEAEVVFMQVLEFEISVMNTPFAHLEDLHRQLIIIAKIGDVVNFEACMDILDLLYETKRNVTRYNNPLILAASILESALILKCFCVIWHNIRLLQFFFFSFCHGLKMLFFQIASYLITVPKQIHEFPLLPWVAFSSSFKEDEVLQLVEDILKLVLHLHPLDKIESLTSTVGHS